MSRHARRALRGLKLRRRRFPRGGKIPQIRPSIGAGLLAGDQLVGKEPRPSTRLRRQSPGAEDDLRAHRECLRPDRFRGLGRTRIPMYAHQAEVVAEARLHHGTGRGVQWLTC